MTRRALWLACAFNACTLAQESPTTLHSASLLDLFPSAEAASLAQTLPAKRQVFFRVRKPADSAASGVLVYVSPTESGELPEQWLPVLDEKKLLWIAADDFGNAHPTAERILVTLMALRLAKKLHATDDERLYVAGMSGGGRIASETITRFPQLFSGAFFIVGANFHLPDDARLQELVRSRRMAFLTGNFDFNRRDMRLARDRYRDAGVTAILWMDEKSFGHQLATPPQLARAIDFLDSGP